MKKLLALLLALPSILCAQPFGQNPTFAYTGALASIPATCRVAQLAFITDATAGTNIYECASANTWTQQLSLSAASIGVTDAGGDTTTWPLLAGSQTGTQGARTTGGLTFNATTNALTTTTFIGALTGAVNGNTLTAGSSTYTGTAAQTYTFPTTSATIARTDAANTFTGVQTMTSPALTTPAITGLATGSGVATANTVSTLVARDGSGNFSAGTITAALTGTASGNLVSGTALSTLATQATNTVVGNATSGTAVPTALAVGTCSTAASALKWTTNTGFGCNTSIDAATLGTATFASPGTIGGSTPGNLTATNIALGAAAVAGQFANNSSGIDAVPATGLSFRVLNTAQSLVRFSVAEGTGTTTVGSTLIVNGQHTTAAGTTAIAPLVITSGTNLTTATANAVENDGVAMYGTQDTTNGRAAIDKWQYFRLTGSGTGITTIADFFGANSGIPLVANGVYEIEWVAYFSQATAGTATWTVTTATTALATLTGDYNCSNIAGIGTVGAPQTAAVNVTASSATAFPVTGTEATAVTHFCKVRVMLTAGNGSSNTRLRLTMSAGTATPLINSYFRVRRLPAANTGAFVA